MDWKTKGHYLNSRQGQESFLLSKPWRPKVKTA